MPDKFTRDEYMAFSGTEGAWDAHRRYYAQFFDPDYIHRVAVQIGKSRLLASTDPHLNDIPLHMWDVAPEPHHYKSSLKAVGDFWSLNARVCVAKEAARQFIEKNKPQ